MSIIVTPCNVQPVGVIPFGDVLPRSMALGDTFWSSVYVVLNQSY